MPIYEYHCQKCGEFEFTQKITEEALECCPTCGQVVKKLISNTSFRLIGTGWYLTDYARKGKPSEDGKGDKTSPGKTDGKADNSSGSEKKTSGEEKPTKEKSSVSRASST